MLLYKAKHDFKSEKDKKTFQMVKYSEGRSKGRNDFKKRWTGKI